MCPLLDSSTEEYWYSGSCDGRRSLLLPLCFRAGEAQADWLSSGAENNAGSMWTGLQDLPHGRRPGWRSHIWCKWPPSFWNLHLTQMYCDMTRPPPPLLSFILKMIFLATRWRSTSSLRCLSYRVLSPSWRKRRTERFRNSGQGNRNTA